MRLESAMYASREGLNTHGSAISVIGDNISNVNTVAFKPSRSEFADLYTEGIEGSLQSDPRGTVGTGVEIGKVRQLFESGTLDFTNRDLDVGISGNGFFMVGDPASPLYSRAGNFQLDQDGVLTNADGLPVLGFAGTATTLSTLNLTNFSNAGTPTTTASIRGNLAASSPNTTPPANPQSFAAIAQAASYISNTRVYDSLGAGHDITMAFSKTGVNTWTAQAFVDGADVGGTAGIPTQLGANTTLTFDSTGKIDAAAAAALNITATPAWANGAAAGNFTINLGSFTQFASQNQLSAVTQDGKGTGNITNYEIGKDGTINAVLDSGTPVKIGQLQMADFPNVDGLERIGQGTYRATTEAGAAVTGAPGSTKLGTTQGGALEQSTVDLSKQFTDLVLFQRGYQANSQILTTANGLLHDTIGLIR